jgi:hypothetical protein
MAHPQLVILSAQRLHTAASLLDIAQVLAPVDIPLAYGGLIFSVLPSLRDRVPGHFLGDRLELAPQIVERLLAVRRVAPAAPPAVPESYPRARDHYQERLGLIETSVAGEMSGQTPVSTYLSQANRQLALSISAALTLGDLAFLGTDLQWVAGLMQNRQMPRELLADYMEAYYRASRAHLDEPGEPILTWLDQLAQKRQAWVS